LQSDRGLGEPLWGVKAKAV